ncbi:MAG: hypothetical protein AB1512_18385 [Thermodesulfobacteriota bacterium]
MNSPFANLHTHTYFSDGVVGPEELLREVQTCNGLECFALTDHDSLSGIEPLFRFQRSWPTSHATRLKRFVPGVELSLRDGETNLGVHLIGLFPRIQQGDYVGALHHIETVLGGFCRERSLQRGLQDMDARIRKAYTLNLDGLAETYESAEQVISILRKKVEDLSQLRFQENEKAMDVIRHPIPVTYQGIIDHWEDLLPGSSKEKIILYTLRPARSKREKLSRILVSEGWTESEAEKRAAELQGVLTPSGKPVIRDRGILEGLALLQEAGAVTILAHPAVDHHRITYEEFDRYVLGPMIQNGLEGIEAYYPYDPSYREEAISHYLNLAGQHDLLVSGGTDFHGDGRVGLDDVRLGMDEAMSIVKWTSPAPARFAET